MQYAMGTRNHKTTVKYYCCIRTSLGRNAFTGRRPRARLVNVLRPTKPVVTGLSPQNHGAISVRTISVILTLTNLATFRSIFTYCFFCYSRGLLLRTFTVLRTCIVSMVRVLFSIMIIILQFTQQLTNVLIKGALMRYWRDRTPVSKILACRLL